MFHPWIAPFPPREKKLIWNENKSSQHYSRKFLERTYPSKKLNGDLTNGPLNKLLGVLLDTHVSGVRSVGPVGDFLEPNKPIQHVL